MTNLAKRTLSLAVALLSASLAWAEPPATEAAAFASCAQLLLESQTLAVERNRELRSGLWDKFRALEESCTRADTDPQLAARAVHFYLWLPEYSDPESHLALLGEAEESLRQLPEPTPELIEVLGATAGTLSIVDRDEEALEYVNEALDMRRVLYGPASVEVARGLIGLGNLHVAWAEKTQAGPNRRKAVAYGEAAMDLLWERRGEKDPAVVEMAIYFASILERVGMEKAKAARLLAKYDRPPEVLLQDPPEVP